MIIHHEVRIVWLITSEAITPFNIRLTVPVSTLFKCHCIQLSQRKFKSNSNDECLSINVSPQTWVRREFISTFSCIFDIFFHFNNGIERNGLAKWRNGDILLISPHGFVVFKLAMMFKVVWNAHRWFECASHSPSALSLLALSLFLFLSMARKQRIR